MTPSEKLQKVIERAVKNGFINNDWIGFQFEPIPKEYLDNHFYCGLIFDPYFCKAYFGDQQCCYYCGAVEGICCPSCTETRGHGTTLCQYHVVKLALTPPLERIDYLFSFIENENIKLSKISK